MCCSLNVTKAFCFAMWVGQGETGEIANVSNRFIKHKHSSNRIEISIHFFNFGFKLYSTPGIRSQPWCKGQSSEKAKWTLSCDLFVTHTGPKVKNEDPCL